MREFTELLRETFIDLTPFYIPTAHARSGTKVAPKADGTPVTDLDRFTLEKLRNLIGREFPDDYTVGEEDEKSEEQMAIILANMKQHQWTIDGLDGTWHYKRGTNSYGAMISRRYGSIILYAAVFRPVDYVIRKNGFFFAEHGHGTWEWCGECETYHQLHTAQPGTLERPTFLVEGSSKKFFKGSIAALGQKETTRPSLSSCIACTTVARGDASGVVTIGHKPWDGWPIVGIVQGAGGVVTDHQGNLISAQNCSEVVAAANFEEHARIMDALNQY